MARDAFLTELERSILDGLVTIASDASDGSVVIYDNNSYSYVPAGDAGYVLTSQGPGFAPVWSPPAGGGEWGDITGTLSDQTDLQNALDAKQNASATLTDLSSRWTVASASGPSSLEFLEDTDNGTNKVTLSAPSSIASDRAIVFPDSDGTIALTANKLSAFASTTSAELAGVISDETGTGALVFANTPTLVTPNLGVASATSLSTTGGINVNTGTPLNNGTITLAGVAGLGYIVSNGSLLLQAASGDDIVFNDNGDDVDVRMEGDTDSSLFFLDASTDRIGIGKNNPSTLLDVDGTTTTVDLNISAITAPSSETNYLTIDDNGDVSSVKLADSKSLTIESPTDSEDITMFFTPVAITVTEMNCVLLGSDTPSVTWTVRFNSDRSATGTEVVTSGTTTTSTTTGSSVTSFNDATIPADSWVWLETTAQSGTVDSMNITVQYTID